MFDAVTLVDGVPMTTTLAIAEGTRVQHKNVLGLVRTYRADLEQFGLLAFKTRARLPGTHGGGDVEYALLNERQAMLLLTYMRNSKIVREFKMRLVKRFYEMEALLESPPQQKTYKNLKGDAAYVAIPTDEYFLPEVLGKTIRIHLIGKVSSEEIDKKK